MLITFYVLAALLLLQGLVSLLEGWRLLVFVRRSLASSLDTFTPQAAIIMPCKGTDVELAENLRAVFQQDYPNYEILVVVATTDDAALPIIEQVMAERGALWRTTGGRNLTSENASLESPTANPKARIIVAGISDERSEKVNNLMRAVEAVDAAAEALVFVDSDARVRSDWLRSLIAPLADEQVGATTGYRWYLPASGGFFSALLSAWNGSVATTLGDHPRNFAWGGSMAIRKKTFAKLNVLGAWSHALSDDYALTTTVQRSGLRIAFAPRCMTIAKADATCAALLEFTTRQVIITRVYNARLWWTGFISQLFFNLVFFGGGLFAILLTLLAKPPGVALALLALIYILGSAKGVIRLLAARAMLPQARRAITRLWWMYSFGWLLVSVVYFFNFIQSATTRRIRWRGVLYEMRSPQETRVIR
ncbi:MAG: glycosyltransferase [Acidobacteria bacterium]|nr:glycosyltransferase [Acidobacteriota bacterium]